MFSQASAILSEGGGGMHGRGRGCTWQVGACMARGGMCGGGEGICGGGHACRRHGHWSGQYATYWNAFLFSVCLFLALIHFKQLIHLLLVVLVNSYFTFHTAWTEHIILLGVSRTCFADTPLGTHLNLKSETLVTNHRSFEWQFLFKSQKRFSAPITYVTKFSNWKWLNSQSSRNTRYIT